MAGIDFNDPSQLAQALYSPNPLLAAEAAQKAARKQSEPSTETRVTLFTNMYKPAGEANDYIELEVDFERNAVATASIVLKGNDPLVALARKCRETVVPVVIQVGELRWSGRVDNTDFAMKDGKYTCTLQCVSDYNWFNKILVWPNFLLPIQAQIPSRAVYIGPAITCIKTMIAEQCFRLQSGLWELVNNLGSLDLDWTSWFGTLLESDGNPIDMLMTPIVVLPTNPIFDTSPWISINGRMDRIAALVEQAVKDNGLVLSIDIWLPGDPQPEGLLIPLHLPTLVVDVKNRSGVTGPTGTFIDGIVTDLVDLQHGVLGEVLNPFLNPANQYAPDGVNIAPLLGVDFVTPWVLFQDHPRGGLTEFHVYDHHPLAHTVVGGGKSPKWLNDMINATFEFLIDAIEITVGFTGIPDTLLDGTLDDIFLAFQQMENGQRRIKLGPYGYPEYWVQTGASAYTLDEWFALMGAMWDSRGYTSVQLTFDNGYPYTVGKDLFIGALASFAFMGELFTDYVEKVTVKDTRTGRAKVTVQIGDGKGPDNPFTKIVRKVTSIEEFVNIVTMSS